MSPTECKHGRYRDTCSLCEVEDERDAARREREEARAEVERLKAENTELKGSVGSTIVHSGAWLLKGMKEQEQLEADNAKLRAEVEKHVETLSLALVAIAGGGICTPLEGYARASGAGWLAKNIKELRARLALADECAELLADLVEGEYRDRNKPLWPRAKTALRAWREGTQKAPRG